MSTTINDVIKRIRTDIIALGVDQKFTLDGGLRILINDAKRDLARETGIIMGTTDDGDSSSDNPWTKSLTADTYNYTYPVDLLWVLRLTVEGNEYTPIPYSDLQYHIDEQDDPGDNGYYSFNGTELWVYPNSTTGDSLEMWFVKKATDKDNATDEIDIPDEWILALKNYVVSYLCTISSNIPAIDNRSFQDKNTRNNWLVMANQYWALYQREMKMCRTDAVRKSGMRNLVIFPVDMNW